MPLLLRPRGTDKHRNDYISEEKCFDASRHLLYAINGYWSLVSFYVDSVNTLNCRINIRRVNDLVISFTKIAVFQIFNPLEVDYTFF